MLNIHELTHIKTEDCELFDALYTSLHRLYMIDHSLFENQANERSIVARLSIYFQAELNYYEKYSRYVMDLEYNRNGHDPKLLPGFMNGAYPDLIIHKRNSNAHNLLIAEFKTPWNCNQEDIEYDMEKIEQFADQDGEYQYTYGILIVLGKTFENTEFELFIDSEWYNDNDSD